MISCSHNTVRAVLKSGKELGVLVVAEDNNVVLTLH